MKNKKSFIKKFLCLLAIVLTFGLCLLPTCKCSGENYENSKNCDYVNRLTGIEQSGVHLKLYINNENVLFTGTKRYLIQMFNKNALQTPVQISILNSFRNVYCYDVNGNQTTCSAYTTNSNYGYYSGSTSSIMNYFDIEFGQLGSINYSDYVFNITISSSNSAFTGSFCPNTYYNVGGQNNLGSFQYFKVELIQQYTSSTEDISSEALDYEKMMFTSNLANRIFNVNNNNSYQYYIRVYFNNAQLEHLRMLYCRYLEIQDIKANNVLYSSYSSAQSSLAWLGNNVYLYSTSASLFKTSDLKDTYKYDTIQYITFRLPDYTFKSSSYYQSSLGINGYLANLYMSSLEENDIVVANQSFANGKRNGYTEGYADGFNYASSLGNSSFGSLMLSVADVPIHIIYSILNFNILGTNLANLFMAFISLMLFVWLIRRFKE